MAKPSSHTHTQAQLDNYANAHNPTSSVHQANLDNHANQLNPNNAEFYHSRGVDPADIESLRSDAVSKK